MKYLGWAALALTLASGAALAQADQTLSADRQKSDIEVTDIWPASALNTQQGRVVAQCQVGASGTFSACQIESETPADQGFGPLTLKFLRDSKMKAGGGAGGVVRVAFHFKRAESLPRKLNGQFDDLTWVETPTWAEVQAAFPVGAKADVADVQLRCSLLPAGSLSACRPIVESPRRQGFAEAAMALAPKFSGHPPGDDSVIGAVKTDVKFHFVRPSGTEPRQFGKPRWLTRIDMETANEMYPVAATKAGVDKGSARLHCDIVVGGRLTNCAAVSENPVGLGFGDAALKLSKLMRMNPWSEDGVPLDGLSLTFPVNFSGP